MSLPFARALTTVLVSAVLAACATPPAGIVSPGSIVPGTAARPREVVVIARDYLFEPAALDLVPGETVLIHLFDAGLLPHELVIGDAGVQAAWERAEADAPPAAPGQTPAIVPPPLAGGLRVTARSGERVDVTWTVPATNDPLIAGCHIPGHWARGMQAAVRLLARAPASAP